MTSYPIKVLFTLIFLFFSHTVFSQKAKIDSLQKELQFHKKRDTTKVNLLNAIAYHYQTYDIDKALETAMAADSLAKKLDYKKGLAKSYTRRGKIHLLKSEIEEAESTYREALKIYQEIDDPSGINSVKMYLAEAIYYNNDIEAAIVIVNEVLENSLRTGDVTTQGRARNNLGVYAYLKGNFEEALVNFKKSIEIKEQQGETDLGSLNNIGTICLNQGKYREALVYFNKCLSIHKNNQNKKGIAQASSNMSAVYYELKEFDKTLDYLDTAYNLYTELKQSSGMASCLLNMGAVYADLKEFSKALDFMQRAIAMNKKINDKAELTASYFQLGDLHLSMGASQKAIANYAASLDLSIKRSDKIFTCHANIGLARAYKAMRNYAKSKYHALEGKKIADDLELLQQQKMASGILADLYSINGYFKKAFYTHQEFKKLNDSIYNKENLTKITQLEYDYKYKQALDSASIRELKLTREVALVNNDLEKSQRNIFMVIIALLGTAIVLGGTIFYLKLRNAKTKNQNILIEQKLLRSQMTPHFIFNSLSVLQGMILNKEDKKSVSYLSKFSKLLRIILENSRNKVVPLSQEIAAIDNYMALQNLDADPPFEYTLSVAENIDQNQLEIPPMLIQPFVENAIEHAFGSRKENKEIAVHLTFQNKKLCCTIQDNGIGIYALSQKSNNTKKSLATTITKERLEMLAKEFKVEGSMIIEDRKKHKEQGTLVTLVIPYKIIEVL